jgi:hypothetical protein
MSKIIELKQQKTKLLLDAQALVTKKDATKEDRQKANAMLADVDLLEVNIAIEERVAKDPHGELGVAQSANPVGPTSVGDPVVGLIEYRLLE